MIYIFIILTLNAGGNSLKAANLSMNFKFFETKRRHIAVTDENELFTTDRQYKNTLFKKLDEVLFVPLNAIEIQSESMETAYHIFTEMLEKERLKKKRDNALLEEWAEEVEKNRHQYSAEEIYKAALVLNKRPGWQGADLLLAESPFSKAVLKKAKKYTVTPFSDGFLLIKIDGKNFGNKRGWADINEYLNDHPVGSAKVEQWMLLVAQLKEIANSKNKTQQEIAETCGLSQSNVSRFFSLKYKPHLDTFLLIAEALKVNFFFADQETKS